MMRSIDLSTLLDLYDREDRTRLAVGQNFSILKCIRGGLRMALNNRIEFDPRRDYWFPPERRLTVAYLADRWTGRFVPASALRGFALHLARHFDAARQDGLITQLGVDYEAGGGLDALKATLLEHARRLAATKDWDRLRKAWPKLPATAAADVEAFVNGLTLDEAWEPPLRTRFPWLAYLGSASEDELRKRQAFFYGYANLWTTTNAYVHAGAQSFASVIQNTPVHSMLGPAAAWAGGELPSDSKFPCLGRDDDKPQDRSEYAAVIEVFGFLNLQRAPFYNNLAETYRAWFELGSDLDAYQLTKAVGERTSAWLEANPAALPRLLKLFREFVAKDTKTRVSFEEIASPKARKNNDGPGDPLLDASLLAELEREGRAALSALTDSEAASLMFHLLLDSQVFLSSFEPEPSVTGGTVPLLKPGTFVAEPPAADPVSTLPVGLRPFGERALAYLHARMHVLFAGAPGTGKTTLAQFVGYAWNQNLANLPEGMPSSAAPLTTVGNSSWSPFHTIGGLVPDGTGAIRTNPGIFIAPDAPGTAIWRLVDGAIVLDEMNRADLDRCIGDLYPLLSGTVGHVSPAGLPGVRRIEASPNFRVLATVNDAHLDDIVFPISDGLARRFQRIELQGASKDDVVAYLALGDAGAAHVRAVAAMDALETFFEVVRDDGLLVKTEEEFRLPFGVAYFQLLRAWLEGSLVSPVREHTVPEQAKDLLASSLRTLGRSRKWDDALRTFLAKA